MNKEIQEMSEEMQIKKHKTNTHVFGRRGSVVVVVVSFVLPLVLLLQPCNHPGLRSGQSFVGTPGLGRKVYSQQARQGVPGPIQGGSARGRARVLGLFNHFFLIFYLQNIMVF